MVPAKAGHAFLPEMLPYVERRVAVVVQFS